MKNLEECNPLDYLKKPALNLDDEEDTEIVDEYLSSAFNDEFPNIENSISDVSYEVLESNGKKLIKIKNLFFFEEKLGKSILILNKIKIITLLLFLHLDDEFFVKCDENGQEIGKVKKPFFLYLISDDYFKFSSDRLHRFKSHKKEIEVERVLTTESFYIDTALIYGD